MPRFRAARVSKWSDQIFHSFWGGELPATYKQVLDVIRIVLAPSRGRRGGCGGPLTASDYGSPARTMERRREPPILPLSFYNLSSIV
jgi:hypothetical protein